MFGDCFGTKIPESGQDLPAGCFFGLGAGFALTATAFFAAAFGPSPSSPSPSSPVGLLRRRGGLLGGLRRSASSRTSSVVAFFVGTDFLVGLLFVGSSSRWSSSRRVCFAAVFFAATAWSSSPWARPGCRRAGDGFFAAAVRFAAFAGALDASAGDASSCLRPCAGAFLAAAGCLSYAGGLAGGLGHRSFPSFGRAAPDGESGEWYAPVGPAGQWRSCGEPRGPRSRDSRAAGFAAAIARVRSAPVRRPPSTPSIRTRLVREDCSADQRDRGVLHSQGPGEQCAGGVVRPAVGRWRSDPELQRGTVATHDRGPAGPGLDVHIDAPHSRRATGKRSETSDTAVYRTARALRTCRCPPRPRRARKPCVDWGGRPMTSSPRASGAAGAPTNGCSTRVRRPPTADRGSTTSGPACSRTSTPGSTPCGASTCRARPAGTATGCRSRSRSRRSSASRASPRSRSTASRRSTSAAASR